jgi:SAM-dependent methyltransferase
MQMDAAALKFADDSFDIVYAPYVVNCVPDPIKVVREMRRVCKPGGKMVILNHYRSTNPFMSWFEGLNGSKRSAFESFGAFGFVARSVGLWVRCGGTDIAPGSAMAPAIPHRDCYPAHPAAGEASSIQNALVGEAYARLTPTRLCIPMIVA